MVDQAVEGKRAAGSLFCCLSALLYGLNSVLVRQVTLGGITAYTVVLIRGGLAAVTLGLMLKLNGYTLLPQRPQTLGITLLHGFGGGALTLLLLNLAYLYLPAGTVTTLHFLYPLLVNLGGLVLFRQRPQRETLAVLAAVLIGVGLLAGGGGGLNGVGLCLSMASAVTWSFHMLFLEHSQLREEPPLRLSFWQGVVMMGLGAALTLPQDEPFAGVTLGAMGLLFLSTLCALVTASVLLNLGIRRIGAGPAAVFSVFEPLGSLLFGALLLGERPSTAQWIGIAVILTSILILLCRNVRSRRS